MEIIINGQTRAVPEGCTAQQLVEILEISGGRIAMEVNREIVPRSTYTEHKLRAGDAIEIVHAVGGGQPTQ
ncbi:MAG: sulfur carrier protein ThiS [Gammaproteobacteria bacterium]|nr:sulfur carrier protein ThiS [Gammaproteobacteria bacterium]